MSVTIQDLSLSEIQLGPELDALRDAYFKAVPDICIERASLITKYSLGAGLFQRGRITALDKARLYRRVLETRRPIVWHTSAHTRGDDGLVRFPVDDTSPFAGSTTSKYKGVPLYPEFMALGLWPELHDLSKRQSNPYFISDADIRTLNFDLFPHWMKHNIVELARARASADDLQRLRLLQKFVLFLTSKVECISHTIPDFSRAVREGLRAVIDEALARRDSLTDPYQRDFYQAMAETMEGIIAYAHRLADEADRLALRERDAARQADLAEIARIYRRVPEHRAATFREGLTTVWLCWTAVHLENPNVGLSLGRLDQLLYPLYRDDIASHRITVQDAVRLVAHLWLKIGDHVPMMPAAGEQLFGGTGSNQAITIGGVDSDGRDAVNELTYVVLRATELMKLRDPNLNARFHPDVNDDAYLRRLIEVNVSTGATPALHNDRAVIRALTATGHTLEQARDYGVIGCVEPGSNGRFYGHSGSILINLPSALELTLFNGRHRQLGLQNLTSIETGDPAAFTTFAEFQTAFQRQAQWILDQAIGLNELLGRVHQQFYPTPLLSALFEGPMQKGTDLIEGGAALNGTGIAIIGLADVTDSLAAIDALVFRESRITLPAFVDAVRNEFKDRDDLLARIRNVDKTPHYGNDDPRADSIATWLAESLNNAVNGKRNYRGGTYRVGYWTMTNHAGFGRFIGATPNGRKKGENFASGITPCSGVTPALTPALHSVAKLPPACLSNGIALNLKFTPDDGDRERMMANFIAAVKGYFDCEGDGGMEVQFNVTSHADFMAAVRDPAQYEKLLVRVSGYTAYFKDLNPQMQKEIIDRTEYRLSSGSAVPYDPFPLPPGGAQ